MPKRVALPMVSPCPDVVFYHANCPDGFGAAWAYWRARTGGQAGCAAPPTHFIPLGHHDTVLPDVKGLRVIMVDVALRDTAMMDHLASTALEFRLLDHHQTGFEQYQDRPWAFFDLTRSGSVLAWADSHPDEPLPRLLRCIQDRDLERPMDIDTEAVLQVVDSIPRTFEAWEGLHRHLVSNPQPMLQNGRLMRDRMHAAVERLMVNAIPVEMDGHKGWAVNAQIELGALAANRLALREGAEFGFAWFVDAQGLVRGSWRSHTLDVIPLARHYRGGGHPYSAGATMSLADIQTLLGPARIQPPGHENGCSCDLFHGQDDSHGIPSLAVLPAVPAAGFAAVFQEAGGLEHLRPAGEKTSPVLTEGAPGAVPPLVAEGPGPSLLPIPPPMTPPMDGSGPASVPSCMGKPLST